MGVFGKTGTGPAIDANLELCAVRKGGEEFPMELSLSKFQTPEGSRVVGVMRDISERKRREKEAAQMQEKLLRLEVSESLGEIVIGIMHEFNNHLTSIMGFAELLIVVREDHPDRKKYSQMIVQATERATKLAGTLLRMVRGNNEISPICMNDIVDETCGLLLPQAQKNNVIVCKKLQPVAFVMGNYVQLGSVLMNMFINSMHAMESCEIKELTISTEDVFITGNKNGIPDGSYVLLQVLDTGCGISEEVKGRIFENFFTTKKNGSGIGMTMAMNFVKKHNGHIKLFSDVGKGTRFEIYLPSFTADQII